MVTRVVKIWCASLLCTALVALAGCASGEGNSAPSAGPVAQQAAPAVSPQASAVAPHAAPQPTEVAPQDSAAPAPQPTLIAPQDSAVAAPQPTEVAPQDSAVAAQDSAVAPPPSAVTPQPAATPVSAVEATPPAPSVAAENPGGPKRISPQSVRQRLASADPPLLVCAYANDEKCRNNAIDGAITYNEFKGLDGLPQGREIIFYCA
jgi:hypothetical protein